MTCVGIARRVQECGGSRLCEHKRVKRDCKVILTHRGCRWCPPAAQLLSLLSCLRVCEH